MPVELLATLISYRTGSPFAVGKMPSSVEIFARAKGSLFPPAPARRNKQGHTRPPVPNSFSVAVPGHTDALVG